MLDLELVTPPTEDGLSIVSLEEMKQHLRILHNRMDDDIKACIIETADLLHGRDGGLNRTIFPTTWVRYLSSFPSCGVIQLPYPPLIEVVSITGGFESPSSQVDSADYVVRKGGMVGEVELIRGRSWPTLTETHPRNVAITFRAGYTEYPGQLKRLIKILAGHYFENKEATLNDGRFLLVSRAIEFGVADIVARLRVPVAHDEWE
jgi:uncharacterized phiE125 gp8 family phage protein